MQEDIWDNENLIKVLQENGVVVMPTDTIYGIVGRAENPDTVNRIYKIRQRNPDKPCIILIGDTNELEKFSVSLSTEQKNVIKNYWPGSVSIILDCLEDLPAQAGKFSYLHRGTKSLAFRLPEPKSLRELLLKVGPLIAPSANLEALPPSKNITEAKKYFGNTVDLYIDGGEINNKHSKLVRLHKDGTVDILRE